MILSGQENKSLNFHNLLSDLHNNPDELSNMRHLYIFQNLIQSNFEEIQSVPPIWKHIQTQFSIFQNHTCQKVRPDFKFLGKKLLDGTLKPRKIKLKVFSK